MFSGLILALCCGCKSLESGVIIGNYQVDEPLGRGGMGIVYRGHHLQLPRQVAIKSISAEDHKDLRRLKSRFEKEAYIQSQLDHPGIVKVYDYIVAEQTYYIVMEYVQGHSLAELLERESAPFPTERALDLFEKIVGTIAYVHNFIYRDQDGSSHKGLIHRDLKPANILVTPDDRVKITDFGIVKFAGKDAADTLGGVYGSPEYVSPEQAEGKNVNQCSDIYSLGVILYEMLTGAPPFGRRARLRSQMQILRAHIEERPRPPSEINAEISLEIEKIILRALEKKPEDRFECAVDFLRAVRRARGRETGDLKEIESVAPPEKIQAKVGTQEIVAPTSSVGARRENYHTQPIGPHRCMACGAEAHPEDKHCRTCGSDLAASPSTVKLTRAEEKQQVSSRAREAWFITAFSALALIIAAFLFARRSIAPTVNTPPAQQQPSVESQMPTPMPLSALTELKPARVQVDSNFNGYTPAPLTDGETDVRKIASLPYNQGNWASAETQDAHWIELSFERPTRIAAVYVFWGFDHNRFMPSRVVELQTPDDKGDWRTVSVLEPGDDYDRTAFEFAPVTTDRVRILQPVQQGPKNRPFVMWVREVKIFGINREG